MRGRSFAVGSTFGLGTAESGAAGRAEGGAGAGGAGSWRAGPQARARATAQTAGCSGRMRLLSRVTYFSSELQPWRPGYQISKQQFTTEGTEEDTEVTRTARSAQDMSELGYLGCERWSSSCHPQLPFTLKILKSVHPLPQSVQPPCPPCLRGELLLLQLQ
jgi:hypothetical protein